MTEVVEVVRETLIVGGDETHIVQVGLTGPQGPTGPAGGVTSVNGETGDVTVDVPDVSNLPDANEKDALDAAHAPGAGNAFATMDDLQDRSQPPITWGPVYENFPAASTPMVALDLLESGKMVGSLGWLPAGDYTCVALYFADRIPAGVNNAWVAIYDPTVPSPPGLLIAQSEGDYVSPDDAVDRNAEFFFGYGTAIPHDGYYVCCVMFNATTVPTLMGYRSSRALMNTYPRATYNLPNYEIGFLAVGQTEAGVLTDTAPPHLAYSPTHTDGLVRPGVYYSYPPAVPKGQGLLDARFYWTAEMVAP